MNQPTIGSLSIRKVTHCVPAWIHMFAGLLVKQNMALRTNRSPRRLCGLTGSSIFG